MIDKNYNPLNPFVGQVQKFLDEKKIPDDQVVPFLMSMGYRGLAGAVASRMRLEKASEGLKALQQGQNQPAPPNVMQENEQKAQQVQQQVQQAMAGQRPQMPPQQAQPPGMAGGGIVVFSNGGGPTSSQTFDELENMFRTGTPAEQARILQWAEKNMPTFAQYLRSPAVGKIASGAKKVAKGAPAIGGLAGLYGMSQTDPENLQRESRLAQLGMDVDPSSAMKTYAAGLAGIAESAIPFAGLFYDTPLDKAQAASDKRRQSILNAPGAQTNLNPQETGIAQNYMAIVRQYGANSPEAKEFEKEYRGAMGRASPEDEDALAQYMAQSAAGGRGAGGGQGAGGGPRLPSVGVNRDLFSGTIKGLQDRLGGMPDVSKADVRQTEIDKEIAARMKRYTDMGIMKPFDDAKANVQGRLKELEGIKDKNFYKAMAMMGFTMAGTRGSFFQALAAGGAAGLSAYETFEDKRQSTLDKLQNRMSEIDMGIANLKERAGSAAEASVDKLKADRDRINDQIMNLQTASEQLAATQAFQLAMSDREIAAQAARDDARFGGLGREIEQDISRLRQIAQDPKAPANVREAARKNIEKLYKERERATQVGSGSYQSAELKALATQNPYNLYPKTGNEGQGGDTGLEDILAKYGY
jgi:hypothetical protein